ncbi:MAG: hypothetical protein MnENMB40S_13420 [Rhizobiaceae bacterium MnEN-MB40S]|nr:MAG: hypothetical protein MnENMB40S_13420 [Rhizobiaceae bacterium MnEN-MB40S]
MNARLNDLNFHDPVSAHSQIERLVAARQRRQVLLSAASESVPGDSAWYVLSVLKRSERNIERALQEENICAWVPLRWTWIQLRRKRKPVRRRVPIFDGYVLVNVVPGNAAFAGLLSFKHVFSILGNEAGPVPVFDKNIRKLNRMLDRNVFEDSAKRYRQRIIREGVSVEIIEGAFAFTKAIVKEFNGGNSAKCVATLFGGNAVLNIPLDKLRKIE